MYGIKGLFFDVGGTVFDWQTTVRRRLAAMTAAAGQEIDSARFAVAWRRAMFKVHTQVRHGDLPWINADEMHLRALQNLAADYPLLAAIDLGALVEAVWSNLETFPGSAAAIDRLRRKYTVVVLTILSWKNIVASSKKAGVQWDGILSCEFLGYYKPSLQAYKKAVALLGLKPPAAMMVAAHDGDLAAARDAGMRTAYIAVPEKDHLAEGFATPVRRDWDIEAADFSDLCEKLQA